MIDSPLFQEFHGNIMEEFFKQNVNKDISDTTIKFDTPVGSLPVLNKTFMKAFECDKCTKVLSSQTNLMRHRRAVHQGINPYQCDQCFKCFSQKSNLKRHQTSHLKQHSILLTDHPPKALPMQKTIKQFDKKREETDTLIDIKPFDVSPNIINTNQLQCHECLRLFRHKGALTNHRKSHLSSSVSSKKQKFVKKKTLIKTEIDDQNTNRGILSSIPVENNLKTKGFKCEYCQKVFLRNSNLTKHLESHESVLTKQKILFNIFDRSYFKNIMM